MKFFFRRYLGTNKCFRVTRAGEEKTTYFGCWRNIYNTCQDCGLQVRQFSSSLGLSWARLWSSPSKNHLTQPSTIWSLQRLLPPLLAVPEHPDNRGCCLRGIVYLLSQFMQPCKWRPGRVDFREPKCSAELRISPPKSGNSHRKSLQELLKETSPTQMEAWITLIPLSGDSGNSHLVSS